MSEDINNVIIVGRLTRDAELKYTNTGTAICSFSIASNRSVKRNEKWEDEASFFDCRLWGKRGESLNQHLTKGQQVIINGSLKQDRWENDGQKHSRILIDIDKIQLIGAKQGKHESHDSGYRPPAEPSDRFEDDIPF